MTTTTKSPLQSKTILASLTGLATTLLVVYGILTTAEVSTLTELLGELWETLVLLAAFVGTIYGRLKATGKIKF